MVNNSIKIVPLTEESVSSAVEVHIRSFPDFFLTFLGPMFLKEFYQSFIKDDIGIAFVAQDITTNQILGVIAGPLIPDDYFKRLLKKRWWAFCLASITAVIKKPSVIKRLFRAVFYRGEAPACIDGLSLLSSVAVLPDMQAKGIGTALVNAFIEKVKQRGRNGVFLTTDAERNEKVIRFYKKLAFSLEKSYTTPEGRKMNRYVLLLDKK